MKQITIRKARHICSMPACGCTDTYRISGSPNTLGGFYLCGDCIATLARLAGVTPQKKPRRPAKGRRGGGRGTGQNRPLPGQSPL